MINLVRSFYTFFSQKRYSQFFVVGISGVLFQLVVTWLFTRFVFGLERYFYGYVITLFLTLIFGFVLHTLYTFGATYDHGKRFVAFTAHYAINMVVQATLLKWVMTFIEIQYYLWAIAIIIFVLSNINFFFFKYVLFKKNEVRDLL